MGRATNDRTPRPSVSLKRTPKGAVHVEDSRVPSRSLVPRLRWKGPSGRSQSTFGVRKVRRLCSRERIKCLLGVLKLNREIDFTLLSILISLPVHSNSMYLYEPYRTVKFIRLLHCKALVRNVTENNVTELQVDDFHLLH